MWEHFFYVDWILLEWSKSRKAWWEKQSGVSQVCTLTHVTLIEMMRISKKFKLQLVVLNGIVMLYNTQRKKRLHIWNAYIVWPPDIRHARPGQCQARPPFSLSQVSSLHISIYWQWSIAAKAKAKPSHIVI